MPGDSLPPVVCVLQGDISDLVSKVAAAKSEVESMDDVVGTAHVYVDKSAEFDAEMAAAMAEVEAFGALREDAHIGVDTSALSGAVAGGGLLASLGLGGGLLSSLGLGGGAFGIFASFGSILSLMGLGFEHFVTTAVGLVGSLAGAIGGLGVLALGVFGTMGVGLVTDLGGIGQAAGDIKNVTTVLTQYQTMSQGLAKQLPQSAAAQAALNAQLNGFAPAARSAVLAASLTASQFHWMYDQVTATAEALGANIINQAMQVGEKFLPTLGAYATKNMGIIEAQLQPLFAWLQGTGNNGGLGIFANLEKIFTGRLPQAMHTFDQGLELLLKMVNYAAPMTGGLMGWLNKFLTELNTPTGFSRVEGVMSTLVGMFHDWLSLIKQVGITLYDLFSQSQGLGTGIITTLTGMLKSLDKWLTSVQGKHEIDILFGLHKTEMIDIEEFLGDVLSVGGQIYLHVVPAFLTMANLILKIANAVMGNPIAANILGWGVAVLILYNDLRQAVSAVTSVVQSLVSLPGKIGAAASAVGTFAGNMWTATAQIATFVATNVKAGATTAASWVASAATSAAAWVASMVAATVAEVSFAAKYAVTMASVVAYQAYAVALMAAKWIYLTAMETAAWIAAGGWVIIAIAAIVAAVAAAVFEIATHWSQITTFFKGVWNTALSDVETFIDNVIKAFEAVPGEIGKALSGVAGAINKDLGGVPGAVLSILPHLAVGGYLGAGQMAVVGESGPELFMSGNSGYIAPNSALGGTTVNMTTNVTVTGGTSSTGLAQMNALLNQRDQQLAQRLRMGW